MTLQQELSKKRQEALAKENVEPTTEEISLKETVVTNIIEKNLTPIFRMLQATEPTNKILEFRISASEDSWSIDRTFPYCKQLLRQRYHYLSHSIPYYKEVWNEISIKAPAHGFIVNNEKPEYANPYGYLVYTITMYLD